MSVQDKKPFPEERAAKLALAREKALEVRRKNKEIKMRAELEKMETARTKKDIAIPEPVLEPSVESIGHTEIDLEDEGLAEDEIEPPPAPVKKVKNGNGNVKKPKKQQVVIVEQSDDDSDEFESQPNVVFVKRTKPKKKTTEPVQPAPLPPPSQTAAPPAPEPPPKPRLTQEQMQVQSYYNNMFNGNFAMQRRR